MKLKARRVLGLLVIAVSSFGIFATSPTCTYISTSWEEETSQTDPYKKIKCEKNNICAKLFNITFIGGLVPYFRPNVGNLVIDTLAKCCGNCMKYSPNTLQNMTELTRDAINSSDFVFPIFASSDTQFLYGFHFLPTIKVPSTFYITKVKRDFLKRVCGVWPAIIVIMLLALVAGFFGWAFETWENEEEFPRPFHLGLFEGFWWSFVSMTTVGYGDKSPKSRGGRLFSAIWIVIGIVAFGLVSGDITGHVVKTNSPPAEEMNGKNVGTLKFRDYDSFVVSNGGGNAVYNTDSHNFASDVIGLIDKLMNDEIDGFLLDKFTLWIISHLKGDYLTKEQDKFFMTETLWTEQEVISDQLSYGMLIRNTDDYNYFKDFVLDAQLRMAISWSSQWVKVKANISRKHGVQFYTVDGENTLFSPNASIFQETIIVLCVVVIVICIVGVFYELHRRKILCKGDKVTDNKDSDFSVQNTHF